MNYFNRFLILLSAVILSVISIADAGDPVNTLTTSCQVFMNSSVLNRSTSYGEEQVVNGNYQGVAQQYNNLNGQLKSVWFRGRVNPNAPGSSNTIKVVVYNANQGLPGTIIGSQNVIINSAPASYDVLATFSSPLSVNGDVIISIEPFSPSTDNFFIERNMPPDGQFLNLIKIKQANQWFKNLAAGDPTFDFDFMIVPVTTSNVTASFISNTVSNITTFTNNSINATSYEWAFGDGNTSTSANPTHGYVSSGTYNVKLKAFYQGVNTCVDSITIPVSVTITSLQEISEQSGLILQSNLISDELVLESRREMSGRIVDVAGKEVASFHLRKDETQRIDTHSWNPGIYMIQIHDSMMIRLAKWQSY